MKARRLISMRFDPDLLEALDRYAVEQGSTRTTILEELARALLEDRLGVIPESNTRPLFPAKPLPGKSLLYPALIGGFQDE